jgi:hypothetical protein
MHDLRRGVLRRDLEGMDAVEEGARGLGSISIKVGKRRAMGALGIPFLARRHAGMAADAGVKVDDKAEFALGGGGQAGHALALVARAEPPAGVFGER